MSESKMKRKRDEKSKNDHSLGDGNSSSAASTDRYLTNNAPPRSRSDKEYSDQIRKRKRNKKRKSDRSSERVHSNGASSPGCDSAKFSDNSPSNPNPMEHLGIPREDRGRSRKRKLSKDNSRPRSTSHKVNISESKMKRKRKEKSKTDHSSSSGRYCSNNALPRSRSDEEYSDQNRKRERNKKRKSGRSSERVHSNGASSQCCNSAKFCDNSPSNPNTMEHLGIPREDRGRSRKRKLSKDNSRSRSPSHKVNISESKMKPKREEKSKTGHSSSSGRYSANNSRSRPQSHKFNMSESKKKGKHKEKSNNGHSSSSNRHSATRSPSREKYRESNKKQKHKKTSKDDRSLGRVHSIDTSATHSANDMVELEVGFFYNNKDPLHKNGNSPREGVFKGGQVLEGMGKIPLAIRSFSTKDPVQRELYQRDLNNIIQLQNTEGCECLVPLKYFNMEDLSSSYIAMTLCHKTTLADIKLEKLCPDQRRFLFSRICRDVAELLRIKKAKKLLANMNLKPSKFLFSINGRNVMISHFGLSNSHAQGWRPAEGVSKKSRQNTKELEKSVVFTIGLLGIYILYNKHHPFADARDKTNPTIWEKNIKNRRSPNLEPLKEDHLERDLFEKMLSHDPAKRPNIKEVLQHCMFWSPTKILSFLRVTFDNYTYKKERGNQVTIYFLKKTDSLILASEPLSTETDSKPENAAKKEMRDVLGGCWLDKVKDMDGKKGTKVYDKSQRDFYPNSLTGLSRYIRNNTSHGLRKWNDSKQETVKFWVGAFPKYIPYLLKIMKLVFTEEDRKEYIEKWAETGDFDVGHLLGEMP